MSCSRLCLAFLLLMCFTVVRTEVSCKADTDCAADHCCVFENGIKYGGTSCRPLGQIDASCRPNESPLNMTVKDSPSSQAIPIKGHYMVCPCRPGLQCFSGSCQYPLPYGSESHPAQVPHRP